MHQDTRPRMLERLFTLCDRLGSMSKELSTSMVARERHSLLQDRNRVLRVLRLDFTACVRSQQNNAIKTDLVSLYVNVQHIFIAI